MTTEKLLVCKNCGHDGLFNHVGDIYTKRVRIGHSYFNENCVLIECENCGHRKWFKIYRRWRNDKHTNNFRRALKNGQLPS